MVASLSGCCIPYHVNLDSKERSDPLQALGFNSSTLRFGEREAVLEKTIPLPPMAVNSFSISSSGRYFLVGLSSGPIECYQWAVKVYDTVSRNAALTIPKDDFFVFRKATMSPNEKLVAALTVGGLKIWSLETGRKLADIQGPKDRFSFPFSTYIGRKYKKGLNRIIDFAFMPDSKRLVLGTSHYTDRKRDYFEDKIEVYDINAKKSEVVYTPDSDLEEIAVHPRGHLLAATAAESGEILILDTRTWEAKHEFSAHTGAISAMRFTRDGRHLVTGGFSDNTVKLWDVSSGQCLWHNDVHTSWVVSTASSRRLDLLATHQASIPRDSSEGTESVRETVRFFDLGSGEYLGSLRSNGKTFDRSVFLSFTPDGSRLVGASSHPSYVYVWELDACP